MSGILCKRLRLMYWPTPKVGSTTVKSLFARLDGLDEEKNRNWGHDYFFTAYFSDKYPRQLESCERFCVVRDPVARFLSGYKNRVREKNKIMDVSGNVQQPYLAEFLERFESLYSEHIDIRWHFAPQTYFIGGDPSFYDRVITLEELDRYLSEKLMPLHKRDEGAPIIPRQQVSENWRLFSESGEGQHLKERIEDFCRAFYCDDYKFIGGQ